jgi:hypothetical protein
LQVKRMICAIEVAMPALYRRRWRGWWGGVGLVAKKSSKCRRIFNVSSSEPQNIEVEQQRRRISIFND